MKRISWSLIEPDWRYFPRSSVKFPGICCNFLRNLSSFLSLSIKMKSFRFQESKLSIKWFWFDSKNSFKKFLVFLRTSFTNISQLHIQNSLQQEAQLAIGISPSASQIQTRQPSFACDSPNRGGKEKNVFCGMENYRNWFKFLLIAVLDFAFDKLHYWLLFRELDNWFLILVSKRNSALFVVVEAQFFLLLFPLQKFSSFTAFPSVDVSPAFPWKNWLFSAKFPNQKDVKHVSDAIRRDWCLRNPRKRVFYGENCWNIYGFRERAEGSLWPIFTREKRELKAKRLAKSVRQCGRAVGSRFSRNGKVFSSSFSNFCLCVRAHSPSNESFGENRLVVFGSGPLHVRHRQQALEAIGKYLCGGACGCH